MFAALMVLTAIPNPVNAQDEKREMLNFAKQYQDSYNNKDTTNFMAFYTKDAEEINIDGTTIKGTEAIRASMKNQFENSSEKIKVIPDKSITENDGSVTVTGTYYVTGISRNGEKIEGAGAFTNTLVKNKGRWQISKSILTKM